MKKYPSIGTKIDYDVDVIGFDKLDGSNIRAFWTAAEKQFVSFGTRTLVLKPDHRFLGPAIELITTKYEAVLNEIFLEKKYKEVTAFFEYYGENSFAGRHVPEDEKKAVLIDLMIYKKGLVHPEDFVQDYLHVGIPEILFRGKMDENIVLQIKEGTLPNMSEEGLVFKGRGGKKGKHPVTFKVKSNAWIERLKTLCGDDEELFRKMV